MQDIMEKMVTKITELSKAVDHLQQTNAKVVEVMAWLKVELITVQEQNKIHAENIKQLQGELTKAKPPKKGTRQRRGVPELVTNEYDPTMVTVGADTISRIDRSIAMREAGVGPK